ncbi:DUF3137 domain-containing protein [Mycoplasmopsis fermentans]|uniref:DUF3137 domain-containing protein n=2 Tax=Mycoplasmopsis fermentans TaxID=2115 RepID=C4XE16_MYCFP|nr:DUF3137 domain-containing protein [Mycoplasmopsis fermentans]VEU66863.1 Uncharacterised protein [Mesomycoplasma conjunctivae]ADV34102.1 Hypothetical Protein MfeM64YM_0092 [Mycoplasmopsis fermentans M64]RMX36257.1 hypothetical protein MFI2_0088 [Mycoplasmopsis fermentans MF-I2]VEU60129.1 Uncharacterised protein [Mycoplasmopsis fermentans]BAH69388.1 hypothetical protein MBIO_0123 [Mycoplasmopsis fermentans PG18]
MGVTTKPKSYLDFVNENLQSFKEIVSNSFDSVIKNKKNILSKLKILLIVSIVLLVLGGIGLILSFFFFIKTNSKNTAIFAGLIISAIVTGIGSIVLSVFLGKRKKLFKELKHVLDKEKLFDKAFEKLSYKAIDPNDPEQAQLLEKFKQGYDKNRDCLDWVDHIPGAYWIPSDANVDSTGKIYFVMDKNENPWVIQTVRYHWVREERDLKGNITIRHIYDYATLFEGIFYSLPKSKNFTLAIGNRCGLTNNLKQNIKYENQEFDKLFKAYCSDSLKGHNIYQPYPMEITLEHCKQNKSYVKSFGMLLDDQNIKCWVRPRGSILEIDMPSNTINKDKIVKTVCKDILEDTYSVYWLFSLLTIPGYFN